MTNFTFHTLESAPERAQKTLAEAKKRYGFVPNLLAAMAEVPPLLKTYLAVGDEFAKTSLTPIEQQVVILTVSRRHECHYCMAAHSMAAKMVGLPEPELEALRSGETLSDSRLEALRAFTDAMVESRGWVSEKEIASFLGAGFTRAQILEVILGIAFKTLSNYTNHAVATPLDPAFESFAWESPSTAKATS